MENVERVTKKQQANQAGPGIKKACTSFGPYLLNDSTVALVATALNCFGTDSSTFISRQS